MREGSKVGMDLWMSAWSDAPGDSDTTYWLGGYVIAAAAMFFVSAIRSVALVYAALAASRSMFAAMLRSILRAPMSWFDQTPTGRILNRVAADVQKARWVRLGRPGHFCTVGLWQYSRHPNYFGEMLQWWCAWLLAFAGAAGLADAAWWATAASPLFTMHVLLNIPATGVAQANGKNLKRYYDVCPGEYARYRAQTSILLPMVGYARVPLLLKRTLLLDLERYEYRPSKKE